MTKYSTMAHGHFIPMNVFPPSIEHDGTRSHRNETLPRRQFVNDVANCRVPRIVNYSSAELIFTVTKKCARIFVLHIILLQCSIVFCVDSTSSGEIVPRVPPWLPPKTVNKSNIDGNLSVLEGSFDIPTKVRNVNKVTCAYIIPMAKNNIPAPSAPDVILRFGWFGQNAIASGEGSRALATKYGFTILTLIWPRQEAISVDDKSFSLYPESGSGTAWMHALANVRVIGRLPPRKIFVLGFSAGASSAHHFTEAYPDEVEGLVAIAGRTFVDSPRYHGPVLLMHSNRDRASENEILEGKYMKIGAPVLHLTFPPDWTGSGKRPHWEHNSDGSAWEFSYQWLAALAEQRQKNNGELLPVSRWPIIKGKRIPGVNCIKPLLSITNSPQIITDPSTGRCIVMVKPPVDQIVKGKGTVWWVDRHFGNANKDDMFAILELLASHGYHCIGTAIDDDPLPISALQEFARQPGFSSPPIHLALVSPQKMDLMNLSPISGIISKVELIRPYASHLSTLSSSANKLGLKMCVLVRQSVIDGLPESFKNNRMVFNSLGENIIKGDLYKSELDFMLEALR